MTHPVTVIGPREVREFAGKPVISTVFHANDWSRGLSPFVLGPCPLYGEFEAANVENGWQYAKLYPAYATPTGEAAAAYWPWATAGWANPRAVRYPMGKGARPSCSLWDGEKLDYVTARERIYFPLYRDAVRQTAAWRELQARHAAGPVILFDFDGYDEVAAGLSLAQVLRHAGRKCGHAFVLKAMLLLGPDATPADVQRELGARPVTTTADLFG